MRGLELSRALRTALTVLWGSGALLAAVTAIVAERRGVGGVSGYALAAVALALLAAATAAANRLLTALGLAICAVQPLAVVATAWELTHDISETQVEKLEALGVDPSLGVAVNFVFSACASTLAVLAFRGRRSGSAPPG